jgi:hypothetical protein
MGSKFACDNQRVIQYLEEIIFITNNIILVYK